MRTDAEILARCKEVEDRDWLGTERGDLLSYLTFEAAKPLLNDEATADEWGEVRPRDEESVKAEILDYMPFAWDKANNGRGLSAGRSLDHMSAWLWMLGRSKAADQIQTYSDYGKGRLRAICEEFGWDWRQWDNGYWSMTEDDSGPKNVPEWVESLK